MDEYAERSFHQSEDQSYGTLEDEPPALKRKRDTDYMPNARREPSGNGPLVKLLVPDLVAGAIIGQKGAQMKEIEQEYNAKLRVSPKNQYYPGMKERIVIMRGELDQITRLHDYIVEKIQCDEKRFGDTIKQDRFQAVKIVVPNVTAGLVIGKKGSMIKSIQEETKARVIISSLQETTVSNERIITITGELTNLLEASNKVIQLVAGDAQNMSSNYHLSYGQQDSRENGFRRSDIPVGSDRTLPTVVDRYNPLLGVNLNSFASAALSDRNRDLISLSRGSVGRDILLPSSARDSLIQSMAREPPRRALEETFNSRVTIEIDVPDKYVGCILGHRGNTIMDMHRACNARIEISPRDQSSRDLVNSARVVSVKGTFDQAQLAYQLIMEKLQVAEREMGSRDIRPREVQR